MPDATYILTAEMDDDSFAWLDALRRRHFPPERNHLAAHLTMFHRLSLAEVDRLTASVLPQTALALSFDGVVFLGFGVAVRVRAPELVALRDDIKVTLAGELSRQDAQKWSPHVTIQNKVAAGVARDLHRTLVHGFAERRGSITGIRIWEYLGGPWDLIRRIPFQARQ